MENNLNKEVLEGINTLLLNNALSEDMKAALLKQILEIITENSEV